MSERVQTRVCYSQKLDDVMDESFVLVDTEADAKFVDSWLNDKDASRVKMMRLRHIHNEGVVNEVFMPDTFAAIKDALYWHNVEERRKKARAEHEAIEPVTQVLEPENLDLQVDGLEVKLNHLKEGYIKLDGQKVHGVQAMTIELKATEYPKVTMTLLPSRPTTRFQKLGDA